MSRCARCHAPVPLEARFCSECGTWVVHTPVPLMTLPPAASSQAAASFPRPSALPSIDPRLLDPAFASTEPDPSAAPRTSAREEVRAKAKGTDVRTVDPRSMGPTFPAAAGMTPSPRPVTSPVFGNVALTPIPTSTPVPGSDVPTHANPMPAMSLGDLPALPPSPSVLPPSPSAFPPAPSAFPPARSEAASRAQATIVDDGPAFQKPPLSIGRTPRPLAGFLVSFQYEPLGVFWPLAVGQNRIGRAGARPDVDVAIADATVSSEHALLSVERGQASIEDRGSRNRTFVNGQAIAGRSNAPLRHGDRIRFGSYEAILVLLP